MHLDALLWMFLPLLIAAGSALLAFSIMQARMEVALSKERETLAEVKAALNTQKVTLEERVKATEESTRRQALDDFMQDIRVEERSYLRESKSMFSTKKLMVVQERLYFRNIPLSNWVEHEMLLEEGMDPKEAARNASVFSTKALDNRAEVAKLIQESLAMRPALSE
ncbi:MAG: hypothetical protein JSU00_08550 [Acidobacteria bacterium]|nr:hypothetical protein [Acidobacteriota bacterium]